MVLRPFELTSFAACVWLVAKFWAPFLFNPLSLSVVFAMLWVSEPFRYAMSLMQTHILFVLLTIISILLAEKKDSGWAGLLLALAAAVKITPAALLVYWIFRGRWRAAGAMILWSAALWITTVAFVGRPVAADYLMDLHRVSRVLLLSFNNQSLAAWWMERFYSYKDVLSFQILPLPATVRYLSAALIIGSSAFGGWMDKRTPNVSGKLPLMGALFALTACTVFAPIEWSHYFIVLLFPCMSLLQMTRYEKTWWPWPWIAVGAIFVLNVRPISPNFVLEAPYGFVFFCEASSMQGSFAFSH